MGGSFDGKPGRRSKIDLRLMALANERELFRHYTVF